ncbi:MAG: sulfotransferase [Actinobacteria bacterium]|nr:MAG: sulfotransferase [Actinomycetota bacterium]
MTRADDLVTEACKETGLDDFGSDDFREGLGVYCESAFSEAELNDVGVMAVQGTIVASLANRLRVVDWAARHPDVHDERIDAPLIVIGMFRAGTTFLSNLLDQDPGNRALLRWEAGDSAPPPTPATFRSGPRVDAVRASAGVLEQLNPKMAAVHHEEADGPTECIAVMSQDFKSLSWEAIANVPTYGRWLRTVDQRSAYEYHRLVLQVLQAGGVRGRWTLKSPHHAIALDALTAVYPDARLVLLHRDPVVLCGSVCSLIHTLSATFSDFDHRRYIADHWTAMLQTSISRIDAFRAAHPEHPVLDVQYDDLLKAPADTVARIYEAFGDRLTDEARAAVDSYVADNRSGRFGEHRYDLAEFGLAEREIAERFASYVERYDIPVAHEGGR